MRRVIKNQKKMKDTMYIVFGVFALVLFGVTIINPSYASEGLIIDDALDAIVLYGEVETATDEEIVEESQNIGTTESELVSYEKVVELDEVSQEVSDDEEDGNEDEENLDGEEVDNGENDENEDGDEEGKTDETDNSSEIEEVDNQTELQIPEISSDGEMHEGFQVPLLNKSENDTILEVMNNNEYVVTFNLNGGYWTEEGTGSTNEKSKTYEPGNQGILTNWRTPSKEDLCTDGEKTNMKCMFDGWYLEEEGITRWTGYVSRDMRVYANWLAYSDKEIQLDQNTSLIIMDRNLGATSSGTECTNDNLAACGYHFQWGNNYGFKIASLGGGAFGNGETTEDNQVEYDIWNGQISTYYNGIFNNNHNWNSGASISDNLRGGNNPLNPDIDKQGPCPKNYHVADKTEWDKILTLTNITNGTAFKNKFGFPTSNARNWLKGGTVGNFQNGEYWTSSPHETNEMQSYQVFFKPSMNTLKIQRTPKGYGDTVRCFKNTGKTIKFNSKGGNKINNLNTKRWYEEIINLPDSETMTRENSVFEGWYMSEDYLSNTKVTTTNIDSADDEIILYAKWNCDPGYRNNEDGTECVNSFIIKYHPNGGAFSGMDVNEIKEYTYNYSGTEIIPIYNIQIPDRKSENMSVQSGWMFAGWYTKDGTNNDWGEEFDPATSTTNIAYAKWLPFNDLKLNFGGREIIIMDRNMGAEDVAEGTYYGDNNGHEDLTKLGYYYQWGNNYGFKNDGTIIHSGSDLVSNPEHLTNPWGPDNYYYSNKFIKRNNNPYRWNNEYNKNLWGGENFTNLDIDKQGPCPKGYHVPDALERQAVYNALVSDSHYCSSFGVDTGNCLSSILKLPFAGWRISYNGGVSNQGDLAFYLSSSLHPYWLDDPYIMYFKNNYISSKYSNYPTNAYSVRCFKNSYYKILTLSSDNGEEDKKYEIRWREPISLYTNELVKNGYIFLGRFYDDSEGIKVGDFDLIKQDTKIKALWNKNPQYLYLANGGLFRNQKLQRSTTFTIYKEISKSHNKDEKGNTYTNYNPYLDAKEVITITGANTLNISFPLRGNSSNIGLMFSRRSTDDFDFITIWTGKHLDYSGDNNQYEAYFGKESIKNIWNLPMPSINNIPGDTITFGFTTHEKYGGYGYYAIVTGLVYTDEEGDSLSSIQINEFPSRLGYSFSGRYETGATEPFDFTGTKINQDRTFYAKWNPHHYTIKFELNGGAGVVNDINAIYGEEISLPNVTREGYTFKGWQSDDGTLYNKTIPEGTGIATEDGVIVTLTAQWEKIQESSGNSSSGGGRKSTPAASEMNKPSENTAEIAIVNEHNSADEETDKSSNPEVGQVIAIDGGTQKTVAIKNTEIVATVRNTTHSSSLRFTKEENEAYSFAKSNGLTTTSSIEQAKMNTELTRIQMAKMLSNFAINVLGQEPDTEKGMVNFDDVTNNMDKQYDNAVTKAYQLGIMGQNVKNNEFRPNDTVTRAEFASSLSRLLYHTEEGEYKGTGKYYIPHIAKLYNEGIINKADPKIKEKRGYVMTMLMRTVE